MATTAVDAVSEPSAEEEALVDAEVAFLAALRGTIVAIVAIEKGKWNTTEIYFYVMGDSTNLSML